MTILSIVLVTTITISHPCKTTHTWTPYLKQHHTASRYDVGVQFNASCMVIHDEKPKRVLSGFWKLLVRLHSRTRVENSAGIPPNTERVVVRDKNRQ